MLTAAINTMKPTDEMLYALNTQGYTVGKHKLSTEKINELEQQLQTHLNRFARAYLKPYASSRRICRWRHVPVHLRKWIRSMVNPYYYLVPERKGENAFKIN